VYEPFAGTASVTFYLLRNKMVDYYHINDVDQGVTSLWQTVKDNPEALIDAVMSYSPNVSDFYDFKSDPGARLFDMAFRKLVLHQVSFSGLGAMAGGPLGGRAQAGKYNVDCRWSPLKLAKGIEACSTLLNSSDGVVTSGGWEGVVDSAVKAKGFLYLDPPYYVKGRELYVSGELDHGALATALMSAEDFVLSYDDAPEVRELYDWAAVSRIDVLSHLHHKIIADVAITPRKRSTRNEENTNAVRA